MNTINDEHPTRVQPRGFTTDDALMDVKWDADTGQWFTLRHTDWHDECWVWWHPTGIRVVTNAGGDRPVRDFGFAMNWLGVVTRKDGVVVPVEFRGTNADHTCLMVKMLGGVENDDFVPMADIWPIPLADIDTVYYW